MDNFINQALLRPLELLGHQMLNVLPNVLAMGIILLGGLFTAWASGSFVERLLRVIGFDRLCDRLGMNAALLRGGVKTDPSRLVGRSIYWTVLVLASIAALGASEPDSDQPVRPVTAGLCAPSRDGSGHSPGRILSLELCIPGRSHCRRQRRTASRPTHCHLFPLGNPSPSGRHGVGTTRHCPAHRGRGIRHYLGRNRAGRSHCIRTRRDRSGQRVFGATAGGPIQIQRGR